MSNTTDTTISKEKLITLYRSMLAINLVELKIAELYPSDKIQSPVHLCIGQEAISAGVCVALEQKDHLYGTYRSHGIYIAKGGNLGKLFAELYGKDTGCCRGKGGSMHLVAPEVGLMGCSAVVASTIPVATGDALASSLKGRSWVSVAFFGDGAIDEGVFYESMNFAALKQLPIIYVCENNNYAIHSKVPDRHKQTDIYRIGESVGVPGFRFDGNDVTEVYQRMREAVDKIRSGGGPVLLEFTTYRWHEHVGPNLDHNEEYRDKDKTELAKVRNPLKLMEDLLTNQYQVTEAEMNEWKEAISKEINEAVDFAENSPFPTAEQLYDDVYSS